MFILNILCNICKSAFKESDTIFTSSCGHLFHYHCVNQWRYSLLNCSQCTLNYASHPIYLNIDRTKDYETIFNEFKEKLKISDDNVKNVSAKLKNANEEIKKLTAKLAEKQKKIDEIEKLLNSSEEWRIKFQDIINILTKENEKLFSQRIQKNNNFEEELKQNISKLTAENIKLKEIINENESSKTALNYKNEVLEQRLKHLILEVKKQIAVNINKSMGNLNLSHNEEEPKHNETCNLDYIQENTDDLNNSAEDLSHKISGNQDNKELRRLELAHPNDSRICINGFPRSELVYPLKYTILSLASKMSIHLTLDEILNIKTNDSIRGDKTIVILVKFKTVNTKIEFLLHRNRLKSHASTKNVQIKEFIDDTLYRIFTYANKNLRSKGYGYIYCKNNQVYVKKSMCDVNEIAIEDIKHIDRLIAGIDSSK